MSDSQNEIGESGLVEAILQQAIDLKATDIHIDPERGKLKVRFRIDGLLHTLEGLEQYDQTEAVISKVKVMADINITEKRMPQDGHLELPYKDKVYNFRVATTPTNYGESIVLRMLNRENVSDKLNDIDFDQNQMEAVDRIINSPFGMILITGPTGSGKSTLMYAFLSKLNKPEKSIITLEDPIEYQMDNVRQMQINEAIGWDFAKGMRAILRQDPDVIMLGEIRDNETALMSFQAALTGRLVFSTFHTFDVPGMMIRLHEMGLPKSIIAHSLAGVVAVRMVKTICSSCITEYQPDEIELQKLGVPAGQYVFKKGAGCEVCKGTGYDGQKGIFEFILFDEEIKENIASENPGEPLSKVLARKNFTSLRQNGINMVLKGRTTSSEIIRVLGY